ncbi:amino acid ABC transporter permease [Prauserella sp. PE36]|uniref:amino acid ABC transporter permease n=1 Tax=Prauserella sp. PE36 TaxID=1504709 RepID=UPI0013142FF5|nr:amino acid ABC transporter permease [Prauserella sp. PE36]
MTSLTESRETSLDRDRATAEDFEVKPGLHIVRWVVAGVVLLFAAQLVYGAATNPRLSWDIVADYFFDPQILDGLLVTLGLTMVSQVLATVIGLTVALMALSHNPVLVAVARLYVAVFRTVPTMVQMLFWYYLAAVVPVLSIGIPFGPDLVTLDTNSVMTQFAAALLGLALGEAAFLAEYFRGGIISVPRGQIDAAAACGLKPACTFRRIVLPQALRVILPAYGNAMIINIKNTSLVFVIGAGDLMTRAQLIYSQNFQQIPLLIVVSGWYMVIVLLLTWLQRRIEVRYSRGYGDRPGPGRVRSWLRGSLRTRPRSVR